MSLDVAQADEGKTDSQVDDDDDDSKMEKIESEKPKENHEDSPGYNFFNLPLCILELS